VWGEGRSEGEGGREGSGWGGRRKGMGRAGTEAGEVRWREGKRRHQEYRR